MVLVAPSEVVLQNSQSLQLRRKRRPRWGLGVSLVQEEVEVQVQLALSFFHHQPLIAADSSSRLDVGPMSGEPLVLEVSTIFGQERNVPVVDVLSFSDTLCDLARRRSRDEITDAGEGAVPLLNGVE